MSHIQLARLNLTAGRYNALEKEKASYFVKWFPTLKGELMALSTLDYKFFLPHARFDWKQLPDHEALALQIQGVSYRVGVSKRPATIDCRVRREEKKQKV